MRLEVGDLVRLSTAMDDAGNGYTMRQMTGVVIGIDMVASPLTRTVHVNFIFADPDGSNWFFESELVKLDDREKALVLANHVLELGDDC